jgi:hypothetical protein
MSLVWHPRDVRATADMDETPMPLQSTDNREMRPYRVENWLLATGPSFVAIRPFSITCPTNDS